MSVPDRPPYAGSAMTGKPFEIDRSLAFEIDRSLAFDLALAGGIGLVALAGQMVSGYPGWGVAVLTLLLVLPLVFRRQWPSLALALMGGAALLCLLGFGAPPWGALAVPVMVYSLARWSGGRLATLGLLAGLVGSLLGPVRWTLYGHFGWSGIGLLILVVACAGVVLAAYLIGRGLRQTRLTAEQQARSSAERDELKQAEEEQRSRAGEVNERNRIARELHDIVAHSLSVIVVQAEGGRALAAKRPEQAAETLGTIAETGRNALEEMRRIVGVLRDGETENSAYAPLPGLDDIAGAGPHHQRDRGTGQLRPAAGGQPGGRADRVSDRPGVADQCAQARRPRGAGAGHPRLHRRQHRDRHHRRRARRNEPGGLGGVRRKSTPRRRTRGTGCRGCGSGSPCSAAP